MSTKPTALADFLGKRIDQICPFSIGKDHSANHCAHFVSHVMGYEFATTCKNYTVADKQRPEKGASIRVDEIFNTTPKLGLWTERPTALASHLIFVTNSGNMIRNGVRPRMSTGPRKHIGIFVGGFVWHYGNKADKVTKDPLRLFMSKFERLYITAGQTVDFFYGKFRT